MNDLLWYAVIAVLAAGLVQTIYLLVRTLVEQRQQYWRRRLGQDEGLEDSLLAEARPTEPPATESGRLDRWFQNLIVQTGLGWSIPQALAVMTLLAVLLSGGLLLWRNDPVLALVGFALGLLLPLVAYQFMRFRWRRRVQDQLPDLYFLLARSLRAGLTLDQALETASEHAQEPMAREMGHCVEQIRLGLSVPLALQGVARRINLPDFDVFVTVASLHRSSGGNLTQLLERLASGTRDRNQFRGYFRAATALGRMTATFIALAAPGLFLGYMIWQPDFVARFTATAGGVRALSTAVVLEIIGTIWLYLLLRVDY